MSYRVVARAGLCDGARKVVSGRQIGEDRAALDAAAAVPFPCGGCAWGRRDAGKVVSKVLFLLANPLLIIASGCGDAATDMYLMCTSPDPI